MARPIDTQNSQTRQWWVLTVTNKPHLAKHRVCTQNSSVLILQTFLSSTITHLLADTRGVLALGENTRAFTGFQRAYVYSGEVRGQSTLKLVDNHPDCQRLVNAEAFWQSPWWLKVSQCWSLLMITLIVSRQSMLKLVNNHPDCQQSVNAEAC